MIVLVGSGLEIFAAFPSFGDKIPERDFFVPPAALRIGGWLGGALQWHLTFSWLLAGAGAVYLAYQLVSGNYRQVLFAIGRRAGRVADGAPLLSVRAEAPASAAPTIRCRSWPTLV